MSRVSDRRADVCGRAAVGQPRRAEIPCGQRVAGSFEPVAAKTQQDVGIALEPAHLRAKRHRRAGSKRRRQLGPNPVRTRITTAQGAQVQRASAARSFARLQAGFVMVALKNPTCGTALERPVGDDVGAPTWNHFDVINERFTRSEQRDVELIGVRPAVVHHAGRLDRDPGTLRGLIAVSPVRREAIVGMRVAKFQAAAAASGPFAPATAGVIGHLVVQDMDDVRLELALGIQARDFIREVQLDAFTAVGQRSRKVSETI